MSSTSAELLLSPVYRHAQRTLGDWLEHAQAGARHQAFRTRLALAALDAVDRHRLARWLAWLCLATQLRGDTGLITRLRRLDANLYQLVAETLSRLPASMATSESQHRLSA